MQARPDETALDAVTGRQMLVAVLASVIGWSLDLFDLFILLFVAPVVGRLFFPSSVAMLSLAAVYASFAVTLLMRPVGSALFGSFADRHGRRGAMLTAVIGVGVATAAFGALPSFAQIGVAAPIAFLILRLIQGVFVGGVVASTHTIGTESVPARWRGATSGLVGGGGGGFGALLASLAYFVASSLFPGEAFAVWGWRFMFFTGILSAVFGVLIFGSLEESPVWARLKRDRAARGHSEVIGSPIRTLFSRAFLPVMLVNIMLTTGAGAGYYLTSGFLPTFLKLVNKLPNETASLILIAASVFAIVSAVAVGHFSTTLGRRRVFIVMGVLRLALLPFCFIAIAHVAGDAMKVAACVLLTTFLVTGSYAPLLIFLNERFPTALRSTGTGLSWNIGFAIGGLLPTFVPLASPRPADLPAVLGLFIAAISVIFLIGALVAREPAGGLR